MKKRFWFVNAVGIGTAILLNALLPLSTHAEDAQDGTNVLPLVYFDAVPVSDAIQNLARQADLNFILDIHVPRSGGSIDGRWTNVTCRQVLDQVLKQNDCELIENPATTIARIAPKNCHAKPVPSAVVSETNGATAVKTPLIVMDDVPLEVAITQLAASAKLKVSVDTEISNRVDADGAPLAVPPVSIRWQNVTPRQALAALLDAYDLEMREDSPGEGYWITAQREHSSANGPDTTVMDLYERLVIQLQKSNQTNALNLLNRYLMAQTAQERYVRFSMNLRYLKDLREGRQSDAIKILETMMTSDAVAFADLYSQLSSSQKQHLNLETLKGVREYRDKYQMKGALDGYLTNAFKVLDEQKGNTKSQ